MRCRRRGRRLLVPSFPILSSFSFSYFAFLFLRWLFVHQVFLFPPPPALLSSVQTQCFCPCVMIVELWIDVYIWFPPPSPTSAKLPALLFFSLHPLLRSVIFCAFVSLPFWVVWFWAFCLFSSAPCFPLFPCPPLFPLFFFLSSFCYLFFPYWPRSPKLFHSQSYSKLFFPLCRLISQFSRQAQFLRSAWLHLPVFWFICLLAFTYYFSFSFYFRAFPVFPIAFFLETPLLFLCSIPEKLSTFFFSRFFLPSSENCRISGCSFLLSLLPPTRAFEIPFRGSLSLPIHNPFPFQIFFLDVILFALLFFPVGFFFFRRAFSPFRFFCRLLASFFHLGFFSFPPKSFSSPLREPPLVYCLSFICAAFVGKKYFFTLVWLLELLSVAVLLPFLFHVFFSFLRRSVRLVVCSPTRHATFCRFTHFLYGPLPLLIPIGLPLCTDVWCTSRVNIQRFLFVCRLYARNLGTFPLLDPVFPFSISPDVVRSSTSLFSFSQSPAPCLVVFLYVCQRLFAWSLFAPPPSLSKFSFPPRLVSPFSSPISFSTPVETPRLGTPPCSAPASHPSRSFFFRDLYLLEEADQFPFMSQIDILPFP